MFFPRFAFSSGGENIRTHCPCVNVLDAEPKGVYSSAMALDTYISKKTTFWKHGRLWLALVLGGLFTAWFVKGLNLDDFWLQIRSYNKIWILPALIIYSGTVYLRAIRWQILLSPLGETNRWRLAAYICIGYMGNNLIPMRVGELFRITLCSRRENIPLPATLATLILERVLDGAAMLIFVGVSIFFLGDVLSPGMGILLRVSFIGGAFVVMVFVFGSKYRRQMIALVSPLLRRLPKKLELGFSTFLDSLFGGFSDLPGRGALIKVVSTTAGFWFLEAIFYFLVFWGFPELQAQGWAKGLGASVFALAVANLAMIVPSPGYVGTFHKGCEAALLAFGFAINPAQAFAVVLHFVLIIPVTILGGVLLLFFRDLLKKSLSKPSPG